MEGLGTGQAGVGGGQHRPVGADPAGDPGSPVTENHAHHPGTGAGFQHGLHTPRGRLVHGGDQGQRRQRRLASSAGGSRCAEVAVAARAKEPRPVRDLGFDVVQGAGQARSDDQAIGEPRHHSGYPRRPVVLDQLPYVGHRDDNLRARPPTAGAGGGQQPDQQRPRGIGCPAAGKPKTAPGDRRQRDLGAVAHAERDGARRQWRAGRRRRPPACHGALRGHRVLRPGRARPGFRLARLGEPAQAAGRRPCPPRPTRRPPARAGGVPGSCGPVDSGSAGRQAAGPRRTELVQSLIVAGPAWARDRCRRVRRRRARVRRVLRRRLRPCSAGARAGVW